MPFTVLKSVAVDVLLGTTFIDEHILATLADEEKAAVSKSTPITIMEQPNVSA